MFSSFSKKLFSHTTTNDFEKRLTTACKGYDEFEPGLSHKVVRYLINGEEANCLTRLSQRPEKNSKLFPGFYSPNDHYDYDEQVLNAMHQVLRSEQGQQLDFLYRLGVVVTQMGKTHDLSFNHQLTEREFDGYFAHLVSFFCDINNWGLPSDRLPNRQTLQALLARYQQPIWYADAFILEQTPGLIVEGYAEYLRHHTNWLDVSLTPDFAEQLQQLYAEGRYIFCQQLCQHTSLPSTHIPLMMQLVQDNSQKVRKAAAAALTLCNPLDCLYYLKQHFEDADSKTRGYWISAVPDVTSAQPLMKQWLTKETNTIVRQQLTKALTRHQHKQEAKNFVWQLPSYPILTISHEFPERWLSVCMQTLSNAIAETEDSIAEAKSYIKQDKEVEYWQNHCLEKQQDLKELQSITRSQIATGLQKLQQNLPQSNNDIIFKRLDDRLACRIINTSDLPQQPDAQLAHYFLLATGQFSGLYTLFHSRHPCQLIQRDISDIRQLLPLLQPFAITPAEIGNEILNIRYEPIGFLPLAFEQLPVWPLFAQYPQMMMLALEGQLAKSTFDSTTQQWHFSALVRDNYSANNIMAQALTLLIDFPQLPPDWLDRVYELALDHRKQLQQQAQKVAEQHPLIKDKILAGLTSSSKEIRSITAQWLSKLKLAAATTALQQAINKENDNTTRNQLLDALQQCGGDISEFVSPAALAAEAAEGLSKAVPKQMDWLLPQHLPECRLVDGTPVERDIIYWWCVMAVKIKQPEGNNLLRLYLSQLDSDSQAKLAHFILSAFIAQDTRRPSDQEAHEYAEVNQHYELSNYQQWAQYDWGSDYQKCTLEDAYHACFTEHKNQLIGSAIKEKGLLALIAGGTGSTLVAQIQPYMKQHYLRHHQIEAMLSAIVHINQPAVIQFILSIARRYRTKSVQELAVKLVEQIAARNGWSQEELADRTIQTAGFEHTQAPTPFSYGKRTLSLKLSHDLKFQLLNEEGKALKALPQPRKDDDDAAINEIKKWISNCKKELKQIIEQQTARLDEAMITGRLWTVSDWQKYLHQHPVMFHLLQRTLWQVELADGWHSFRPAEDGTLIGLDHQPLQLPAIANLRLLSSNQLDKAGAKAWQAHLKNDNIKLLLEQLKQVEVTPTPEQIALAHHHGLLTDTFTLRGLLSKKGYKRGEVEDGGFFDHYFKLFGRLGLKVEFSFSGNCVPEEREVAAIYDIKVFKQRVGSGHHYQELLLSQVPANLLNAIARDYEDIANKCHADPEWQSKLPW
ncbi:DUF4132 domain-containing protein [Vibrio fujianensis]|uniref:DUF4132 domain-containing protein n=1 Tax=Vibrio fujianensis TaxID=1974215 RepID=UPI000C165D5E|nr:DUF4132 domain-containing protein [Vibrio fujianensis]